MFKQRPNTQHSRKKAFLIIGLLVVTFLVTLGVFLVRQAHKPRAAQEPPPAKTEQTPSAQSPSESEEVRESPMWEYAVIVEWGVRFKLQNGLKEVIHKDVSKEGVAMIGFSTGDLQRIDEDCNSEKAPLGILERYAAAQSYPDGSPKEPLADIGGYYYYFTSPQGSCLTHGTDSQSNVTLLETHLNLLRSSLASLELVH